MSGIIEHFGPSGKLLRFENVPGVYPVNRYQSLLLAEIAHAELLAYAEATRRPLSDLRVLEICCGGGPVANFLKAAGAGYVAASDIREQATKACKLNAELNGLHIDDVFVQDNLASNGSRIDPVDFLACNPPCGRTNHWPPDTTEGLRIAIDGGPNGISHTLHLLDVVSEHLLPGGYFVFVLTSTMDFRRVVRKLNQHFPQSWRMANHTPVAQPWTERKSNWADKYLRLAEEQEIFVWDAGDGWIWRLTWIIVAAKPGHIDRGNRSWPCRLSFQNCSYDVPNAGYKSLRERLGQRSAEASLYTT